MLKNELNISLNKMRGHFMSFNDWNCNFFKSLKNIRQEKVTLKFYDIKMGAPGNLPAFIKNIFGLYGIGFLF